jgi:carotenoid cleavage dioxygenase-like enzyme
MLMSKMIPTKITKIPNILGVANTAIMNIKNKNYALFEQDHPYEINIDFDKNQINTVGKQKIAKIEHFSAHSKYDNIDNIIHTLDYDVLKNSVEYYSVNENFDILNKIKIKTDYIPLIHDFIVLKNNILITDSPLKFKIEKLFNSNIPVSFEKNLPTKIHLLNRKNGEITTYISDESFYIFHYANHRETDKFIEIYAAVYDNLDFSKLDIHGRYRKIVLNKKTGKVIIEKNPELENYNLDFPVKVNNKVILRSLNNNKIDSFLLCEGLNIKKKICIKDKSVCGEPIVTEIENVPYLISFAYNENNNGFLLFINLKNFYIIEIPIPHKVNIGFHSIFIRPFDI